jgi:hypothetical protein
VVLAKVLVLRCGGVISCLLCVSAFAGGMASRSVAACPNTGFVGFSGFLAGCGGYERVTPEFKAGARVVPKAISSDGSRVVGDSIAVFAGDEGYDQPAETLYESVRSGAGWATSAITPPSSVYPAQEFLDFNPNSDEGLWTARLPSQSLNAEDLYIREPAEVLGRPGVLVKVGPMVPPYAAEGPAAGQATVLNEADKLFYAGASLDLSHVFFQMLGTGPLWPGDTTVHSVQRSLYEYVGAGNATPMLVGVDDEGRLISDCGTSLGSYKQPGGYNADTYNAISDDGEIVYFTALAANECGGAHAPEVNEVYARVGVGGGARTVPISEPTFADCEACQESERAGAEFVGASQDGSKAFFMTSQELLKGAVGENLYEYDFHNRPGHKIVRLSVGPEAAEVQGVGKVSEDGSHVYFVAKGVLTSGSNGEGGEPVKHGENLYVFERDATYPSGHVSFIATLSEGDESDWQGEDLRPVQATPDGRFLVFESSADLTNGDSSSVSQVFEYDAAREELARISVGEAGYPAGRESAERDRAFIIPQGYSGSLPVTVRTMELAVSDDGSVVVFESRGGLTMAAKAAGEAKLQSVFEYRSSGAISNGGVFSVSNGNGSFKTNVSGMDSSGRDIFFQTQAPVLASDRDSQEDLYVARDYGGFPVVPLVQDCEREVLCQGSGGVAPVLVSAGSVGVVGGEDLPESTGPQPPPKPAPGVSRVQRLAKALRVCRRTHRPGRARRVCEVGARRRFGSAKAKGKG